MVKNAKHHAFMMTLSLSRDVTPAEYMEIKWYLEHYAAYYCLKAEDCLEEGKVHLHFILIRELLTVRSDEQFDKYGPKRPEAICAHILTRCTLVVAGIASHGSKHALRADPLTTSYYVEYLQKEGLCHCNNLPDDIVTIKNYMSAHKERNVNADLDADKALYLKDPNLPYYEDPVTERSCRRFYRWHMCARNGNKKKRMRDENERNLKKQARALWCHMVEHWNSDDDESLRAWMHANDVPMP